MIVRGATHRRIAKTTERSMSFATCFAERWSVWKRRRAPSAPTMKSSLSSVENEVARPTRARTWRTGRRRSSGRHRDASRSRSFRSRTATYVGGGAELSEDRHRGARERRRSRRGSSPELRLRPPARRIGLAAVRSFDDAHHARGLLAAVGACREQQADRRGSTENLVCRQPSGVTGDAATRRDCHGGDRGYLSIRTRLTCGT